MGRPDIDETIRRLCAFADAGADCRRSADRRPRARERHRGGGWACNPVNLLINAPFATVAEAAPWGPANQLGGTWPDAAWEGFLQAASEIADEGTFSCFEDLPNVDGLFRQPRFAQPAD